jgi:tRNA(fMet)-specific endonuclease VapC
VYLLDTSICIAVTRGLEPVTSRLRMVSPQDLAIPTITIAELEAGVHCAAHPTPVRTRVDAFLSAPIARVSFDEAAALVWGQLYAVLRPNRIGERDLIIASIALAYDLTVVSANVRHFGRVPRLRLENWMGG